MIGRDIHRIYPATIHIIVRVRFYRFVISDKSLLSAYLNVDFYMNHNDIDFKNLNYMINNEYFISLFRNRLETGLEKFAGKLEDDNED